MPTKYNFANEEPNYQINGKTAKFEPEMTDDLSISFAFGIITLKKHIFCFNNPSIQLQHYVDMIEYMSCLSTIKISQLIKPENKQDYHFHQVDLRTHPELKLILKKILKIENGVEMPTICSFRANFADDEKYGIAPRFVGYFENYGIFHLLFLDFHHAIYPNANCRTKKEDWIKKYYELYNIS